MGALDLKLDDDDDLVVEGDDLALVEGVEGTKQAVKIGLRFFLGDWFLDESDGIPFFERIFIKNPNLIEVREWFRLAIADAPGITDVVSLQLISTADRITQVKYVANAGEIASEESVS